ncbi:serine protease [Arthrobacter sp. cf158]|uniref:S8 family serine peptidase n=1 Tax=Arthrobacter sp. cf158 TaxID=1761744 RepID=UPI0008957960|nr:S8 family serine peptidase [Arthrobacter sp. cf158]SDX18035.1 serine protease [Arthrobacter sp. cf158]
MVVIAMAGAVLPALPAAAADDEPVPSAAPLSETVSAAPAPTDQFIVKFNERAGIQSADRRSSLDRIADNLGGQVESVRTTAAGEQVVKTDRKLTADEVGDVIETLESDPSVEYAEPDVIMRSFASAPDDTYYDMQWALGDGSAGIDILGAWDYSEGVGSVVAVIDSGILKHTDLDANILPGYDMIADLDTSRDGDGRDSNPQDEGDTTFDGQCAAGEAGTKSSWHGTHVAGIIAAVADNGKGVAGVAPKSKVVPIRAIGTCGGYTSDIADGIRWAVGGTVTGVPANANPARVVNLSLGGKATCSTTYQNAINFARSKGAVVVAAAGNENVDAAQVSPANCQNVITVAASTRTHAKADYSNFGSVDLYAPGGEMSKAAVDGIVSTLNNGTDRPGVEDYYLKEGTSMAAPHVAGVAALMLARMPASTPADIERRLITTAQDLGCTYFSCRVNVVDARLALRETEWDATPLVAVPPTISGDLSVGSVLYALPGNWGPAGNDVVRWGYQWFRDGVPVPDATSSSYNVVPGDLNAAMTVKVTANKVHFDEVTATSVPTAKVGPGTINASVPVIDGPAYVGSVLKAETGTWEPAPVELTYQWSRAESPIEGATAPEYEVTEADAGKPLRVTVSGSKTAYAPTSTTSAPTINVLGADKAATPAQVVFEDHSYMGDDKYTIPESNGVEYQVSGKAVAAGTYPARGQMTVTATAKPGYLLKAGATSGWSAYFSTKGPDFTAPATSPFKDVLTTQQFYKEMSWLADRKISTGWLETDKSVTYRPVTPINRDAMAAFLYRMAGSPEYTPPVKSPFKDVLTTQQFYKEMSWLAETGISSGWTESDGSRTYKPLTPINRDAMAAFLYRLANSPDFEAPTTSPFQDVYTTQQFYKEMAWMADKKISSGWLESDGAYTYRALSPINRDAMAAFLYRMP